MQNSSSRNEMKVSITIHLKATDQYFPVSRFVFHLKQYRKTYKLWRHSLDPHFSRLKRDVFMYYMYGKKSCGINHPH